MSKFGQSGPFPADNTLGEELDKENSCQEEEKSVEIVDCEFDSVTALKIAEEEFDRFADAWELDTDVATMAEEDADSFRTAKRRVIQKIMSKTAVVDENGDLIYKLRKKIGSLKEVKLSIPAWGAWTDMDRGRKDKNMMKFTHYIANAIGQPAPLLTKMDGRDAKFIQGVYSLFLGS